jgi:hypothetical protein
MRTTVDLPDELFRRAKARAALDGLKLKELIARYVEQGLRQSDASRAPTGERQRSPLPVIAKAATGRPIPAVSRAGLGELEVREDLAKHDRSLGC